MPTLPELVAQYAVRFHQNQEEHHIGSALGAWMLLATASAGVPAGQRSDLEKILGTTTEHANELVSSLLENPHPAVVSAIALWTDKARTHQDFTKRWAAALPATLDTGGVPTQAEADTWVNEKTLELIPEYPLEIDEDTIAILVNALATRITWTAPFTSTQNDWSNASWGDLATVLHTGRPSRDGASIARVEGREYGVHTGRSGNGLVVYSVLGAEGESPESVLAAAHQIGVHASQGRKDLTVSLFDVDLDDTPWNITQGAARGSGPVQDGESYLVAWEATTTRELTDPVLGLARAAVRIIPELTDMLAVEVKIIQKATAHYGRTGFEAAAVSALQFIARGMAPRREEHPRRTLRLDFTRPYAVVAVAEKFREDHTVLGTTWHGVPVFGAWVSQAVEATED